MSTTYTWKNYKEERRTKKKKDEKEKEQRAADFAKNRCSR